MDFGGEPLPTLHSFSAGVRNGVWFLIGGRTNGLHGFNAGGFGNFPPASQNRELWVIDPVTRQSWSRSVEDAAAGFTTAQIDSLTPTNAQFAQRDGQLYITGGYSFSFSEGDFVTYPTLSAIDLDDIIAWTQGAAGMAADYVRQLDDPLLQVTGGTMNLLGSRFQLVFGHDFQGGYNALREGVYTRQLRSFEVLDDGVSLTLQNAASTTPDDAYRRRDLNVVPAISGGVSGLEEMLIVLAGVFTPTNGGWTVPVEIDNSGVPSMADPAAADTFKQSLNMYHSAKVTMFSEEEDRLHILLFGGITLGYRDEESGDIVQDDQFPFSNQSVALVRDADGTYEQHLLPGSYPEIDSGGGAPLRFGTNAEFFPDEQISRFDNGVVRFDSLSGRTRIGFIYGGIVSDAPNGGNTAASARIFEVFVTPVPPLLADFDHDGDVDGQDFLIWQSGFGTVSGATKSDGDADGDGDVDGSDFLIWQAEFGSTTGGGAATATAPSTLVAPLDAAGRTLRTRTLHRMRRER